MFQDNSFEQNIIFFLQFEFQKFEFINRMVEIFKINHTGHKCV